MFKRGKSFFSLSALLSVFLMNCVSALSFDGVTYGIREFFGAVFGFLLNTTSYDVYFFEKILLLLLLFLLIRISLETFDAFKSKRGVVNIIAIAVSLIAVRYLSEIDLIKGILVPYGTMATTILTILPFLIFFFFIHRTIESGTGRKIAWIFYMIVLLGIWWNRYDQLNNTENYIYWGMLILVLILFFFDRRVREYFALAEIKKAVKSVDQTVLIDKFNEYQKALKAAADGFKPAEKKVKDLRKFLIENGVASSSL